MRTKEESRVAAARTIMVVALGIATSFAGASGCTTGSGVQKDPATATTTSGMVSCPLGVRGAVVAAEDVTGGLMLTFKTEGDPAELRERVFDASAMYGTNKGFGKGHDGKHGEGGRHGLQPMQLPPASAASAEIEGGGRIRFLATDSADIETLRTKLRARVTELNSAPCKG